MKKNVWILNHYATTMSFDHGGRHYWFAQNLLARGYSPTIFCANVLHNSNIVIDTKKKRFMVDKESGFPFVFVKSSRYSGNGLGRIRNMISFYQNLMKTAEEYSDKHGRPDVILASSAHPLTVRAGMKLAKTYNIPCICEVRDLWPASIVVYGYLKENSLAANMLYNIEKNIYKQVDGLIFTMAGGRDYIIDKKWDEAQGGPISLDKVFHINNGIVIKDFYENVEKHTTQDKDLLEEKIFRVVYSGSIRKVNEVGKIIAIAEVLQQRNNRDVRFLIYGEGDEKEKLEKYCTEHGIRNVVFKGRIPKKEIPFILTKSDLNLLHFKQSILKKYGASLNKLFEYFASGRPILSDCEFGYDLIKKNQCGMVIDNGTPEQMAEAILHIKNMPDRDYRAMCENSLQAAQEFDFKHLTQKLIEIIEGV